MFKIYRYLKGYTKEVIIGPTFKLAEAVLELSFHLSWLKLLMSVSKTMILLMS